MPQLRLTFDSAHGKPYPLTRALYALGGLQPGREPKPFGNPRARGQHVVQHLVAMTSDLSRAIEPAPTRRPVDVRPTYVTKEHPNPSFAVPLYPPQCVR